MTATNPTDQAPGEDDYSTLIESVAFAERGWNWDKLARLMRLERHIERLLGLAGLPGGTELATQADLDAAISNLLQVLTGRISAVQTEVRALAQQALAANPDLQPQVDKVNAAIAAINAAGPTDVATALDAARQAAAAQPAAGAGAAPTGGGTAATTGGATTAATGP